MRSWRFMLSFSSKVSSVLIAMYSPMLVMAVAFLLRTRRLLLTILFLPCKHTNYILCVTIVGQISERLRLRILRGQVRHANTVCHHSRSFSTQMQEKHQADAFWSKGTLGERALDCSGRARRSKHNSAKPVMPVEVQAKESTCLSTLFAMTTETSLTSEVDISPVSRAIKSIPTKTRAAWYCGSSFSLKVNQALASNE